MFSTLVISILFSATAIAAEDQPRTPIRIVGTCELLMASRTGLEISVKNFRASREDAGQVRAKQSIALDSQANGTSFLGGSMNRESLDFLFSLVPAGTLHASGSVDRKIGDRYVLSINPVFDPNDLWREMSGTSARFAEDGISAGRLRGQTRGWVTIDAYPDGRIEASTWVGHLDAEHVEFKDGEIEFTMPMQLIDRSRIPRGQRLLGKLIAATRAGRKISEGTAELVVKLKVTSLAEPRPALEHHGEELDAVPITDDLGVPVSK